MSTRQATLDKLEQTRALFHELVDRQLDALILRMIVGGMAADLQESGTRAVPLGSAEARCKGTKPVAVVLPNGERVDTPTWKKAAAVILRDCDADPQRHDLLMGLRDRIPGNYRQLLSWTPEGMGAPLEISDGLYLESKFDTQALLDNLTRKILHPVGYDCGGVAVLYREPKQEVAMTGPELDEGPAPPTMLTM